jgi:hypothetical protein
VGLGREDGGEKSNGKGERGARRRGEGHTKIFVSKGYPQLLQRVVVCQAPTQTLKQLLLRMWNYWVRKTRKQKKNSKYKKNSEKSRK